MSDRYEVTRDVAEDERHNTAYRDVKAGEVFTEHDGPFWGAVDLDDGIALTGPDGEFFEFPRSAVRLVSETGRERSPR